MSEVAQGLAISHPRFAGQMTMASLNLRCQLSHLSTKMNNDGVVGSVFDTPLSRLNNTLLVLRTKQFSHHGWEFEDGAEAQRAIARKLIYPIIRHFSLHATTCANKPLAFQEASQAICLTA